MKARDRVLKWSHRSNLRCWNTSDFRATYENSHFKDNMLVRPYYLHNGNPCIGKTTRLYWNDPSPHKFPDFSLTNFQTILFKQDINYIQVFKMKPRAKGKSSYRFSEQRLSCVMCCHKRVCWQLKLLAPLVEILCVCFSIENPEVTRTLTRFATWHMINQNEAALLMVDALRKR